MNANTVEYLNFRVQAMQKRIEELEKENASLKIAQRPQAEGSRL